MDLNIYIMYKNAISMVMELDGVIRLHVVQYKKLSNMESKINKK